MIEFIVSILQIPGAFLREIILAIPLWVAKILFIIYPLLLLIWVLRMDKSEVKDDLPGTGKKIDLRPYVAVSLLGQVVIYLIF